MLAMLVRVWLRDGVVRHGEMVVLIGGARLEDRDQRGRDLSWG
jgi:hypothetical protein